MPDKIMYRYENDGIYDVNVYRYIECVYVYYYMKQTNIDHDKAFLIKTGRKPNKIELIGLEYIHERPQLQNVYWSHWCIFAMQNIDLAHPILIPKYDDIKEISEYTFGHKLEDHIIHYICNLLRKKRNKFKITNEICGINMWQIICITAMLDYCKLDKKSNSIILLFNKIYKRNPIQGEINLCQKLNLLEIGNYKDEIKSIVKKFDNYPVGEKRFHKQLG